jgi:hypothetical protein
VSLSKRSEVEVPRKETVAQPSCHVCRNSLETCHDFMLKAPQVNTNSSLEFKNKVQVSSVASPLVAAMR